MTFVVWTSTTGSQDRNVSYRMAKLEDIVSKLAVRLEGAVSGMADKVHQIENVVHDFLTAVCVIHYRLAPIFIYFIISQSKRLFSGAGPNSFSFDTGTCNKVQRIFWYMYINMLLQ